MDENKVFLSINGDKSNETTSMEIETTRILNRRINQLVDNNALLSTLVRLSVKQNWKMRALEIVPPRLVLGAYRDVIGTINDLEAKVFSTEEVRKEITKWFKDLEPLHPLAVERDRCVKILPTILDRLTRAGLLLSKKEGVRKKGKNFDDFWYLTQRARTSAERAIRWGIYYLIKGSEKKKSLTIGELIDVLTPSRQEMIEVLDSLTIRHQDNWRKILLRRGDIWIIKEKPPLRTTPPSVIKDVSKKLLYTLSIFSQAGDARVDTDRIVSKVRSIDMENIERFLVRLHFEKHNTLWIIPLDITKRPQKLIEKLEMSVRLPAGEADFTCLRLLDTAHLSATEIVGITGIDKSTISRALRRLSNEDLIKLTGKKGPYGEIYYTTNCDNCWFGKDKEECRDETVAELEKILKERKMKSIEIDWSEFSNQTLNRLVYSLASLRAEKFTKQNIKEWIRLWDNLLATNLEKIIDAFEARAIRMVDKEGWIDEERIYELIDEKSESLPLIYLLGVKHALKSKQVRLGLELLFKEKSKKPTRQRRNSYTRE